jgi:hypothetical protein
MIRQREAETFIDARLDVDHAPRGGAATRGRAAPQWLAAAARILAEGARAGFRRFLAALHEARRRQAAIEQARYRHLIYDPETGLFFGQHGPRQKPPRSE